MKSYRRRFVFLNMLTFGIILGLVLVWIGVNNYNSYYSDVKNTMREIVKPLESKPEENGFSENATDETASIEELSLNLVGESVNEDSHEGEYSQEDLNQRSVSERSAPQENGQQPAEKNRPGNNSELNTGEEVAPSSSDGQTPPEPRELPTSGEEESPSVENNSPGEAKESDQETSSEDDSNSDSSINKEQDNSEDTTEDKKTKKMEKPSGESKGTNLTFSNDGYQEYLTMIYYADEPRVDIMSVGDYVWTDEELLYISEGAIESGENFGILEEYNAIYYWSEDASPYKVVLISKSAVDRAILQEELLLLLIFILSMILFLPVSIGFSKFAVRPMEESMEREKQFVADASHDLKTPLAVILANTSILEENPEATIESQRKWIDNTRDVAKNMQGLIQEMLTLTELETRKQPFPSENIDLASEVTKVTLQMEAIAFEKGIQLECDVPESLMGNTNADYFSRVVSSLIENAMKYEPVGGRVNVTLRPEQKRIYLSVQNENGFIEEEDLPHVFERFYRGDKSRSEASGHGLGLAIAKQIVQNLGGKLEVESSPKKGTTFFFTIP